MFSFEWPWLALALPLPFLMWRFSSNKKPQQALKLPTFQLVQSGAAAITPRRFPWMLFIIWTLFVIAAMRPQWLGDPITIPQQGREIIVAVDLSASMDEKDMKINRQPVNRLTMLKYVLSDFIQRRQGDRLGLILFADTAYVQTPLTFDLTTVRQMLDEAVLGLVGDKTAIGDAIGLASKRFSERDNSNKILILLTDGQNTAGNISPRDALEIAKQTGIKIYTIGLGADEMLVKGFFTTRRVNPSADLDEGLLNQIAKETNGQYFRARDTQQLANIYKILDELEPVDDDPIQLRPVQALFYWPLLAAIFASLAMVFGQFLKRTFKR